MKDTTDPQNPGQASNGGNANGASASSDQDLTALQQELDETQNKLKEMTNITQHALADLQNFRRRAEEERTGYVTYANADLINELLPVLENINKALTHEPKDAEWIKGVTQIFQQFQQTLEKRGLKAVEASNQTFDPKIHEALMTGPGPKDQVIEEYEKGYMLGDKVLKRSRVGVGDGEKGEQAAA